MSVVVVGCGWFGVGCRMCVLCCKKFDDIHRIDWFATNLAGAPLVSGDLWPC